MNLRYLLLAMLTCSFSMACGADAEDRLGAVGELCFTDNDCDEPLICEQEVCVIFATSSNDTASNDTASNDPASNDIPVNSNVSASDCFGVCEKLLECFDGLNNDACIQDCESQAEDWGEERFIAFTECFTSGGCEMADECLSAE